MKTRLSLLTLTVIALISSPMLSAFAHPGSGICVDEQGQVFFTDTGHGVWKIDTQSSLTRISELEFHWLASDPKGGFAAGPAEFGTFRRITPPGAKPALVLGSDYPLVFGTDGNLYYADTGGPTRIIRRTPNGTESVLATGSGLHLVTGMAADPNGSLLVVDVDFKSGAHAIRRIGMDGKINTFANGFLNTLEPSPAKDSSDPHGFGCRGIAVDSKGDVYVAATDRRCVVKISPAGKAQVVLRSAAPWSPTGLAVFKDILYVLEYTDSPPGWDLDDRKGWLPRVRKLQPTGEPTTLATVQRNQPTR